MLLNFYLNKEAVTDLSDSECVSFGQTKDNWNTVDYLFQGILYFKTWSLSSIKYEYGSNGISHFMAQILKKKKTNKQTKKTHMTEVAENLIIMGSKRSYTTSYYCLRNSKVPVKRKEHQPSLAGTLRQTIITHIKGMVVPTSCSILSTMPLSFTQFC